jgi:hypothetical protein
VGGGVGGVGGERPQPLPPRRCPPAPLGRQAPPAPSWAPRGPGLCAPRRPERPQHPLRPSTPAPSLAPRLNRAASSWLPRGFPAASQELLYAMERMEDSKTLADYHVPPVRTRAAAGTCVGVFVCVSVRVCAYVCVHARGGRQVARGLPRAAGARRHGATALLAAHTAALACVPACVRLRGSCASAAPRGCERRDGPAPSPSPQRAAR